MISAADLKELKVWAKAGLEDARKRGLVGKARLSLSLSPEYLLELVMAYESWTQRGTTRTPPPTTGIVMDRVGPPPNHKPVVEVKAPASETGRPFKW